MKLNSTGRTRSAFASNPCLLASGALALLVFLSCGSLSCGKDAKPTSTQGGRPPAMVPVAAGTFVMGSPVAEPGRAGNETLHEVTLSRPFLISNIETTQEQWEDVMGWNDAGWRDRGLPVENVTWFDAVLYCNHLSEREGLSPAYLVSQAVTKGSHTISAEVVWNRESDGYRLPTEAEWEYCCRAGTDSLAYPGGPVTVEEAGCRYEPGLSGLAWYCQNSGMRTHAGGSKDANAWGLYDMNGNVWEWCWDRGDTTYAAPATDPAGSVKKTNRALRGGSWGTSTLATRSAIRNFQSPDIHFNYVGFRTARTSSSPRRLAR